jgi:hypothetical protein
MMLLGGFAVPSPLEPPLHIEQSEPDPMSRETPA